MSTAYLLARAGRTVVILDDGPLAGGMTQLTTAHLTNAIDDRYFEIERLDGYLFLPPGEDEELLDRELTSAHRAGLHEVEKLSRAPLDRFDTGPCLRFPRQAQFHPLKYLAGLAKAIERDGGRIFTKSHVDRIDGGGPAQIKVGPYVVSADAVVVATNTRSSIGCASTPSRPPTSPT